MKFDLKGSTFIKKSSQDSKPEILTSDQPYPSLALQKDSDQGDKRPLESLPTFILDYTFTKSLPLSVYCLHYNLWDNLCLGGKHLET